MEISDFLDLVKESKEFTKRLPVEEVLKKENAPAAIKTGVTVQDGVTGTAETSSANSMIESGEDVKSERAARPLLRGGAEINTEASRQEAPGMPAKAKNEMQKQQNRILRNIGGSLQPRRYPAGNGIGRDIASLRRRGLSKRREGRDTKRYCCGR